MITGGDRTPHRSATFNGVFELRADTGAGTPGPMAAPEGCAGPAAYRTEVRRRYVGDAAARQQLVAIARRLYSGEHHGPVPVTGPFAEEARAILARIREERR